MIAGGPQRGEKTHNQLQEIILRSLDIINARTAAS